MKKIIAWFFLIAVFAGCGQAPVPSDCVVTDKGAEVTFGENCTAEEIMEYVNRGQ